MTTGPGLITRAVNFAADAHKGQFRKYDNLPYITHPVQVALTVALILDEPEAVAAAALHDTVEDCDVSVDQLRREFGERVAGLVEELTDRSKLQGGNRASRKERERIRLSKASPTAQTIKLCDLLHNSHGIIEHDPAFAKIFMAEFELLLDVLKDGDALLLERARAVVNEYKIKVAIKSGDLK